MKSFASLAAGVFALSILFLEATRCSADEPREADPAENAPVGFMKDVAPILVRRCIGCHNGRKAESKYNMTSFKLLAKGGAQGEDITLEPGDPDGSRFVELIRPDGDPRMPYKQDALPADQIALIERWVRQGAKYDGNDPSEDWVALAHKLAPVTIPERYPVAVPITATAFSPNDQEIVASGFHELTLWKAEDGKLARRLRGLGERIYDIAYSPDGKWLATASGDPGQYGSVKLWMAEPDGGGKPARDLAESFDCFFGVAFSPDSSLLAAVGADRAVRVWETASGKLVMAIEDHADWVLDVAFSPDGKRLATASRDKTAKVFDVVKKEAMVTFPGHAETVYCVVFLNDGKTVVSGGGDARLRYWKPDDDAKPFRETGGFGGPVFRVSLSPDGKTLLACGADKTIRVFDPQTGSNPRNLSGHNDWIYGLAVSRDGTRAVSGAFDGEVRIWNLADGKSLRNFLAAPGLSK